jgi:hypothetical protein
MAEDSDLEGPSIPGPPVGIAAHGGAGPTDGSLVVTPFAAVALATPAHEVTRRRGACGRDLQPMV